MFGRFSREASGIITEASKVAWEYQWEETGTEALLLGIVRVSRGWAGAVPAEAGITKNDVVDAFFKERVGNTNPKHFTDAVKQVLSDAFGEAQVFGHPGIGPGHLLLALLRQEDDASRFLQESGLNYDTLRARFAAEGPGGGDDEPETHATKRHHILVHGPGKKSFTIHTPSTRGPEPLKGGGVTRDIGVLDLTGMCVPPDLGRLPG